MDIAATAKNFSGVRVTGRVASFAAAAGFKAGGELGIPQGAGQRDRQGQGQCEGDAGGVQGLHGGTKDLDL